MIYSQLDSIIFFGFLAVNILVAIFAGKGNKTIADYALGDRKFSTGAIAGTLIATWICAGFFLFSVSKIYTSGLPFVIIMVANGLMLLILSIFYIPRMKSFLGSLSVADAMGSLYGKQVKVISAIAAICLAVGYVGLQIKVLSNLVGWLTGSGGIYIVLLCSMIVTVYSALGGIRAIVYTDFVQFFTFGVFIPIVTFMLWNSLDNTKIVYDVLVSTAFLDYDYLFSFSWAAIFIWFILPAMDPSVFQRILMAKDTRQASKAFAIGAIASIVIILFAAWLAILVRSTVKGLDPDNIINYILHTYSYTGLIGLTTAGIAAMVMSTVDSYINTAAVLFSEDICKTFGIRLKNELTIAKIFSVLAGMAGIFIALSSNNLFDITLLIANFYVPIVTAPLTLAIFGFRSTPRCALIGIFAGIFTVIIWRSFFMYTGVDSVIPGLFANFIFLIGSHYLLKQGIGWVGVKDNEPLIMIRQTRLRAYKKIIIALKGFKLKRYLLLHAPKIDSTYVSFGLFSLVSTLASMYFLTDRTDNLVVFFYQSILTLSIMFITYPMWPASIKKTALLPMSWVFCVMYILIIVGTYVLLISNFGTIQLITFMANLLVMAILLEWKLAIITIVAGIYLGTQIYGMEYGPINGEMGSIQFKILYVLLVISAALVAFVKPKQYKLNYLEQINQELEEKYNKKTHDLVRALHHREEFIDRFDEGCMQIFHHIANHINELDSKLAVEHPDVDALCKITSQIKSIVEKLKQGTDYLNCLINSLKKIKLTITTTDIHILLDKAKASVPVIVHANATLPIICDQDKICHCFNIILHHAISHANKEITLLVENNFLEYAISFNNEYKEKIQAYNNEYKEKIQAYKITFSTNSNAINAEEVSNLLNPRLNNQNEILFAELANIIDAHYGKFVIEVNNQLNNDEVNIVYIITLPVNVKEVRPKVADVIDNSYLNINKLHKLLHYHERTTLLKIALMLYKNGYRKNC